MEIVIANLVQSAKLALRIVTNAFDQEITDLVRAGIQVLETRGVKVTRINAYSGEPQMDPIVQRCLLTYVRINFGDPADYERLKASFDEQLGQLMTTTGYTRWSNESE